MRCGLVRSRWVACRSGFKGTLDRYGTSQPSNRAKGSCPEARPEEGPEPDGPGGSTPESLPVLPLGSVTQVWETRREVMPRRTGAYEMGTSVRVLAPVGSSMITGSETVEDVVRVRRALPACQGMAPTTS